MFRILFGQADSIPILIELLNAILEPLLGTKIVSLEIMNPFAEQSELDAKACVVDVKARDSAGKSFILEMQRAKQAAFKQRALYYWSGLYEEQLKSGMDYDELKPSILVCIADFEMFKDSTDYLMTFELYNRKNGTVFSPDIFVVTIELPKFAVELMKSKPLWKLGSIFYAKGRTWITSKFHLH